MPQVETTSDFSPPFFADEFNTEGGAVSQGTADLSSLTTEFTVARGKRRRIKTETVFALVWNQLAKEEFGASLSIHHLLISSRTHSLNWYIGNLMSEVSLVERVYSAYRNHVSYTWIVIETRDQDALQQIYQREKAIIERFPEFEFDFYVLYRGGQSIESMISGEVELVFSRSTGN